MTPVRRDDTLGRVAVGAGLIRAAVRTLKLPGELLIVCDCAANSYQDSLALANELAAT